MTPITDKAVQKLKNTYEAKEKLSTIIIPTSHVLVSFDVKSLFTSVPHDLALTCAKKALDSDENLLDRTRFSKENLLRLIQACLNCNTFQYNGKLFK